MASYIPQRATTPRRPMRTLPPAPYECARSRNSQAKRQSARSRASTLQGRCCHSRRQARFPAQTRSTSSRLRPPKTAAQGKLPNATIEGDSHAKLRTMTGRRESSLHHRPSRHIAQRCFHPIGPASSFLRGAPAQGIRVRICDMQATITRFQIQKVFFLLRASSAQGVGFHES